MAKKWVYDLTIHNAVGMAGTQFEESARGAEEESHLNVISCDTAGHCFFDEILRPDVGPFLRILNGRGAEGWELVQHTFHNGYVYLVWKRETDE